MSNAIRSAFADHPQNSNLSPEKKMIVGPVLWKNKKRLLSSLKTYTK